MLAAVLALAVLLRFGGIGEKSLWFDEAYALFVANRSLAEMLELVRSTDTHPPLYYIVLSFWVRWFGTSEAALRSMGAVLSTATVAGTWWLGRRLGGGQVGMVAGFLIAVAPFHIRAAQDARMYPLLGLLTLASWVALDTALRGRRTAWAAYVLATVLMMYTHYFAVLNLLAQGIVVMRTAPRGRLSWLVSQLVILIVFLPWAPIVVDAGLTGRGWPHWRPAVGWDNLTAVLGMLSFGGSAFGFEDYFQSGYASLGRQVLVLAPFVALLLAGLFSYRWCSRTRWLCFGYLVVPIGVAFLFSFRHNVFYARYFSFVYPAFAVVLAEGILRVSLRFRAHLQRAVTLGLILLFLSVNGWVLNEMYSNPRLAPFNWRGAAKLVSAAAGPNDIVVMIPGVAYIPFSYYFRGPQRVEFLTPREIYAASSELLVKNAARDPGDRAIFRQVARHHEVLWIVATGPYPPGMEQRLTSATAGIYGITGNVDFRGVKVVKLFRLPAWNNSH
ncbi:MAG: glycosyltransferase family 39 protein [bacterium]